MKGSLQFIGNATTLIRYNGFTLLTDPNFLHRGQRAYLGYGLSSRRLTDPAVEIGDLPPLDAVLLSHLHGDHWDRVAQRGLDKATPVVTTTAAAGRLRRRGFRRSVGLENWQQHELRGPGAPCGSPRCPPSTRRARPRRCCRR
ncbi:MBL fold metallo-hydrolase [Nonomuraea thailandensis]